MADLRRLVEQHLADPFPASVVKGQDYGEVDAVMIGADIYGFALRLSRDHALNAADVAQLHAARDSLQRSLAAFPEDARPYYERLVGIASAALG